MVTQKAVVITAPKQAEVVADKPVPALRDDYILVKTICVAINPTDWKHIDYLAPPGVLVGCDYAGIVQEVGKNVKKPFKKGDRVCGFVHGSNTVQPEDGAFAEYIVAKGDLQMKIPDYLTFQEATTLGLGVTTAGQGLYQGLKLALPTNPIKEAQPILIYGGSTATGTLAIQFAKISGYKVLTTCSPRNFDQVKRLGADAVFDYRDPGSADRIKELTNDNLKLVFDTISSEDSARYCDRAISSGGGDYSALLPLAIERPKNVNHGATMAYTAFGEGFQFGPRAIPPKAEDYTFAENFCTVVERLLAEKRLSVHPPKMCPAGLNGTLEGLISMREGKVSGEKLVHNIADTP
ncbi:zinc-binding oxidoreductase [Aspergillus pseudotamarii]|uniref:Zinc-binding oxidoreductase n=1 Tax=Aspergillus pseudotamarii TaxID=132259 RepID=A0A5N6TCB2_ASPPS|nr:zinc-binding oxidoreductase [Aspergillus pseudotamarii]KAE8143761.1 zinc-binding oxidoreductase [Aspergillus pseudotamarii]